MGKTPAAKRLVIEIAAMYVDRPEIQELAEKGHEIRVRDGGVESDLILSPFAHYFIPEMFDEGLLETALKAARARKAKR